MSLETTVPPAPAAPPTPPKRKRPPRPKSKPARWAEAVGKCIAALDAIAAQVDEFGAACDELREVQEEYEQWKDGLPDNLQSSAVGEKLQAVVDLEIEGKPDELTSAIDELRSVFDEAESIDLPRGFGRD